MFQGAGPKNLPHVSSYIRLLNSESRTFSAVTTAFAVKLRNAEFM